MDKAAQVSFTIMADALEESFTLEDLEISQIEQVAALPNVDNNYNNMHMLWPLSSGTGQKFLIIFFNMIKNF